MNTPAIVVVATLYAAICALIALWAARRTDTPGAFFVAGRSIGVVPLAVASMAAALSGFAFIGGPGLFYAAGAGSLYIVLPAAITGALSAWVLARRMRLLAEVRGVMTVPEAIGVRYRSPAARGLAAVAMLIAIAGYMATNFLALGLIIDAVFGVGLTTAVVVGAAVILAYSAAGGILAGIYTDLFQGAVMAVASVLVFAAALASGGGLGSITRDIMQSDPIFLSPWGTFSPLAALSLFFVFGLGVLGQPHVVHKYYMVRDPRSLRWYPLLMTGAMLITLLLLFGVGIAVKARVLAGDMAPLARPDDATPQFLLRYTSPLLAGIVFSGVAAAIMSTVNSFINVGAAAVARDLPQALGRPLGDELRAGRIASVVLTVVAVVIALESGLLVALLGVLGWGLFASTLVPSLAIGLAWEGATRVGAIASIATGLGLTVLLESLVWAKAMSLPAGVSATGITLSLSIVVFFGISWLTGSRAGHDLDADVRTVMRY
ncbi:MAG: hypothetical protein ABIV27_01310 [Gemmatimonadales bacterium]